MAGAYPNAPSRRMAWDADGTIGLLATINLIASNIFGTVSTTPAAAYSLMSGDVMTDLNDEDLTTVVNISGSYRHTWLCLLFPEKREIDGFYAGVTEPEYTAWSDYSTDSNNGSAGSWTDMDYSGHESPDIDSYRDSIQSEAVSNVRAVRYFVVGHTGAYLRDIHVYGTITPGETPDRLIFLDTLNADAVFTKVLDYGDVPRGQTQVRTFKVKNNSSTKQANTVQVTAEDLYLGAGAWYSFSEDGSSYQATFPVGNLAAGATKLLYVKQIVPDAQTPGAYAARIKANQASWT